MQNVILYLHDILRWFVLVLLLLSIFKSFSGWRKERAFEPGDRKTWLFTLICLHLNLLIGLYLLLFGTMGILSAGLPPGTKLMENDYYRFFWIEHPVSMIIAVVLTTIAYGMAKKPVSDRLKFKKAFWLFLIALLFVLSAVPWPFRHIVGRPLFPGM